MAPAHIDRSTLMTFLTRLSASYSRPCRLYLVGEAALLWEGWRERIRRLVFAAEVASGDRAILDAVLNALGAELGIEILEESPGDVIPLPAGQAARARSAGRIGALELYHFDPYSVAFRLIARGDEDDYHTVLAFLACGWLTVEEMNLLLSDTLPKFTSETIQQDPAEFRRKYKGLLQMWRAAQAQSLEASGAFSTVS